MPFLFFSLLNLSGASCPAVLDQVAVAVSPAATGTAQELLGLNLLSAADRTRLTVRLNGPQLILALKGGRRLLTATLDEAGRTDLGDGITLVVRAEPTLVVALEVPGAEVARFRRRSAAALTATDVSSVEIPILHSL